MNEDRIRRLADHVESLAWGNEEGKFCMWMWRHDCGAPACIAGWAWHLFFHEAVDAGEMNLAGTSLDPRNAPQTNYEGSSSYQGRCLLGISAGQADRLFAPTQPGAECHAGPGREGHISPQRAAACLRRLADTGRVEWGRT